MHTPGPWKIVADPDNKGKHPLHDNRYIMTEDAEIEFGHDPRPGNWSLTTGGIICALRDQEKQAADARLIAAAPDMLETLKAVVDEWETNDPAYFGSDIATIVLQTIRKASLT